MNKEEGKINRESKIEEEGRQKEIESKSKNSKE